jgi:hypothetical protein
MKYIIGKSVTRILSLNQLVAVSQVNLRYAMGSKSERKTLSLPL